MQRIWDRALAVVADASDDPRGYDTAERRLIRMARQVVYLSFAVTFLAGGTAVAAIAALMGC